MPPSTTAPFPQTIEPLTRVCVERRIFVGDDSQVFLKDWLETFDADYRHGRIEGYVLDLTGGELWGELVLSNISEAAFRDIALRSVQHNDQRASQVFRNLTSTCDPVTAVNTLTCSFNADEWPKLAAVCEVFTQHYNPTLEAPAEAVGDLTDQEFDESVVNEDVSCGFYSSPLPIETALPGQSQQMFQYVLANGSEKNLPQPKNGDTPHAAGKTLRVRMNNESAELVEQFNGYPFPGQLDRYDAIALLICLERLLKYRREVISAQKIQNMRSRLLSNMRSRLQSMSKHTFTHG